MKYISIGVVMAPSTEHILKVSHYGTEFTLTGDLARLWLDAVCCIFLKKAEQQNSTLIR